LGRDFLAQFAVVTAHKCVIARGKHHKEVAKIAAAAVS
jgi:hypothetical protein